MPGAGVVPLRVPAMCREHALRTCSLHNCCATQGRCCASTGTGTAGAALLRLAQIDRDLRGNTQPDGPGIKVNPARRRRTTTCKHAPVSMRKAWRFDPARRFAGVGTSWLTRTACAGARYVRDTVALADRSGFVHGSVPGFWCAVAGRDAGMVGCGAVETGGRVIDPDGSFRCRGHAGLSTRAPDRGPCQAARSTGPWMRGRYDAERRTRRVHRSASRRPAGSGACWRYGFRRALGAAPRTSAAPLVKRQQPGRELLRMLPPVATEGSDGVRADGYQLRRGRGFG